MNKEDKAYWADKTIAEAKVHLKEHWKEGTTCPCCHQNVALYQRPLTSSMAYALYIFNNAKTDIEGYAHAENFFKESNCPSSIRGDFSKLRYWGFIMAKQPNISEASSSSGLYKVLPKGKIFLEGHLVVPASVLIYNNKLIGFGEKATDFKGALKNKFNIDNIKVA